MIFRLDSQYSGLNKRCPECFLKTEKYLYCPCDRIDLNKHENKNVFGASYCEISVPKCIQK